MPVDIRGSQYFTHREVADELGVSRQTLWRWREKGKIPSGVRHRTRQVLFSVGDVMSIRAYADKLDPIEFGGGQQLALFGRGRDKEGA